METDNDPAASSTFTAAVKKRNLAYIAKGVETKKKKKERLMAKLSAARHRKIQKQQEEPKQPEEPQHPKKRPNLPNADFETKLRSQIVALTVEVRQLRYLLSQKEAEAEYLTAILEQRDLTIANLEKTINKLERKISRLPKEQRKEVVSKRQMSRRRTNARLLALASSSSESSQSDELIINNIFSLLKE